MVESIASGLARLRITTGVVDSTAPRVDDLAFARTLFYEDGSLRPADVASFMVSDDHGLATVDVSVDGRLVRQFRTAGVLPGDMSDLSFLSRSIDIGPLSADVSHLITLTATDTAGLSSSASVVAEPTSEDDDENDTVMRLSIGSVRIDMARSPRVSTRGRLTRVRLFRTADVSLVNGSWDCIEADMALRRQWALGKSIPLGAPVSASLRCAGRTLSAKRPWRGSPMKRLKARGLARTGKVASLHKASTWRGAKGGRIAWKARRRGDAYVLVQGRWSIGNGRGTVRCGSAGKWALCRMSIRKGGTVTAKSARPGRVVDAWVE